MKTISKFLISLAAIFFLFGCGDSNSKPEDLGQEFITALYSGDGDKAVKLIDFEALKKGNKKAVDADEKEFVTEKIKSMSASVKEKADKAGGIKEIKLDKAEYNKERDKVRCTYVITFNKDNLTKNENVKLFKKDDKWYIDL